MCKLKDEDVIKMFEEKIKHNNKMISWMHEFCEQEKGNEEKIKKYKDIINLLERENDAFNMSINKFQQKEFTTQRFAVIDKKTGKYPKVDNIALKEKWAKNLIYCDMEGFAITEDGLLILADECGNFAYCPENRFEIIRSDK